MASFGAASLLPGVVPGPQPVFADSGRFKRRHARLIQQENNRPGTRDWLLTKTEVDPETKYRCPGIEGYASKASVKAGESLTLHVSCNPPSKFTIDLYRSGYYNGKKILDI